MSAYTDDDVTALARLMVQNMDYNEALDHARGFLAAVAPAIAARALREAADAMESEPGVTFADALMIRWLRARAEQVGE